MAIKRIPKTSIKFRTSYDKSAYEIMHYKVNQVLNTFDTSFSRGFNVFMILLIIVSTVIFVLDTMSYFDKYEQLFNQLEAVIAILFTVEYILRLWVAPSPKYKYVFSIFAIFDFLAFMPFYLGFLPLGFLRTFRMVRMLRVLRTLRFLKLSRGLGHKLTKAEKEAGAFRVEMQILSIGVFTVWLIFSGIMYTIEHGAGTKGFDDIPSAMWYVIVTITTVGYGDVYPATAMGKIVAAFIMVSGIGIISTLTSIIGKEMMTRLSVNEQTLEEAPAEEGEEEVPVKRSKRKA